ncbi:Fe-S-containing hydro-lyase [Feifania hominis]|uniref:Fe-S-containing hydro-lyase n=1 Tax=Feifania hominis TaxID=2763660 RepID=A0A926HPJ1_9FIRM|nr:Fe-S-containing hydro-lyase [Feifania hominis]MBC8535337.1 Fe-S-containing hydro-lyase [Feifania hominis]
MEYHIRVEQLPERAPALRAGDMVYLSGTIYTSRDAAHKRLMAMHEKGEPFPFEMKGAVIYYAGPTPTKPGDVIGSCGPTTSSRMDPFAPTLLDCGLIGMIGKGKRSAEVIEAIRRNRAVYFCAIGGAGALAAKKIKKLDVIAFPELGCESAKRLEVEEFPVTVAIDCVGGNIFETGAQQYRTL